LIFLGYYDYIHVDTRESDGFQKKNYSVDIQLEIDLYKNKGQDMPFELSIQV